nr:MAG TPA: hypothetical protein [Caudoviricetes sp.]
MTAGKKPANKAHQPALTAALGRLYLYPQEDMYGLGKH